MANEQSFETRADLQAASISAVVITLIVHRYDTSSPASPSVWTKWTTGDPSAPTKITSADGSQWALSSQVVDPYMFGAIGNGSADDRPALQSMIDHAQARPCEIDLRAGKFGVGTASLGSYCLKITGAIKFVGAGMTYTFIIPLSSVADTVDVLLVQPIGGLNEGLHLADFSIGGDTLEQRKGNYGLRFDTTITAGTFMSRAVVERIRIKNSVGDAILIINDPDLNPDGGFFTNTIRNCVLEGGIIGLAIGDSVNIVENAIAGQNNGIVISQVATVEHGRASHLVIERNNITARTQSINIVSAINPKIRDNNIESNGTSTQTSVVKIMGADWTIPSAEVCSNKIECGPDSSVTELVCIDNTGFAVVENNWFASGRSGGVIAVKITANAGDTVLGFNKYVDIAELEDDGYRTRNSRKRLALNSIFSNVTGYAQSSIILSTDGIATISLYVSALSSPSGTVITTIPYGYRPHEALRVGVTGFDSGGNPIPCSVDLLATGNVVFNGPSTVQLIPLNTSYTISANISDLPP